MANDLNQCNFIGRLGKDPEIRYTQGGDAVANFSIACGEKYTNKNTGEVVDKTEWINCVAWRKLAEIISQYLNKGSQVFVSGKMQTRKWQDNDGKDRYTTEILVSQLQMLGGGNRNASGGAPADTGSSSNEPTPMPMTTDFDDDIPF